MRRRLLEEEDEEKEERGGELAEQRRRGEDGRADAEGRGEAKQGEGMSHEKLNGRCLEDRRVKNNKKNVFIASHVCQT